MNTAQDVFGLNNILLEGQCPVVDLKPIRGRTLSKFIIVKMEGTPPSTIFGWESGIDNNKMKISLQDVTIERAYTSVNPPIISDASEFRPIDFLSNT